MVRRQPRLSASPRARLHAHTRNRLPPRILRMSCVLVAALLQARDQAADSRRPSAAPPRARRSPRRSPSRCRRGRRRASCTRRSMLSSTALDRGRLHFRELRAPSPLHGLARRDRGQRSPAGTPRAATRKSEYVLAASASMKTLPNGTCTTPPSGRDRLDVLVAEVALEARGEMTQRRMAGDHRRAARVAPPAGSRLRTDARHRP